MTTYRVTATMDVDADSEEEALQTFIEALADGSVDPTIGRVVVER